MIEGGSFTRFLDSRIELQIIFQRPEKRGDQSQKSAMQP